MTEENGNGNGKLEKKRFELRAGLAIASFVMMCVFTVLLWFIVPESRLKVCADTSFYIYFAFTSITGAAMGFKSWTELKK